MDMKAMLFAGGGLFLAMTATTVMMSGDVARMREEAQAKRAQQCAAEAPANPIASTPGTTVPAPASDTGYAMPAAEEPADDCPAVPPVAPGSPTDPAAAAPAVDPVTGELLTDQSMATMDAGSTGMAPPHATTDPSLAHRDPGAVAPPPDPAAMAPVSEAGF